MRYTLLLLFGLWSTSLSAQLKPFVPDTLLKEDFTVDPSDNMLAQPGGFDIQWVNFDQDNKPSYKDRYPTDWFWDIDTISGSENGSFYSTSFLQSEFTRNRNWLISAPIYIPDSTYWLCWRSAPFQGPLYMDGYQVMVSGKSNQTIDFLKDTIFRAAEMRTEPPENSNLLDLNNYTFTAGYMHANGFTNTNYFYKVIDTLEDGTVDSIFWCKLEPHSVSLAKYAGQTVYVAFLHNSQNDFLLQLDDIVVAKEQLSHTANLPGLLHFKLLQNPVRDVAYLSWQLDTDADTHLRIISPSGQLMAAQNNSRQQEGNWAIDLGAFPAGIYHCILQTQNGIASQRLVKL